MCALFDTDDIKNNKQSPLAADVAAGRIPLLVERMCAAVIAAAVNRNRQNAETNRYIWISAARVKIIFQIKKTIGWSGNLHNRCGFRLRAGRTIADFFYLDG